MHSARQDAGGDESAEPDHVDLPALGVGRGSDELGLAGQLAQALGADGGAQE